MGLRDAFNRLFVGDQIVGSGNLPSFEFLSHNHFLKEIDLRTNKNYDLIGISYRAPGSQRYNDVIVVGGARRFIYTSNVNYCNAVDSFKDRLQNLKELYDITPSGMSEREANIAITGNGDGSTIGGEMVWNRDDLTQKYRRDTINALEANMSEY